MKRLDAPSLPGWLAPELADFTRYAVEIDGHRLHVMEQGEGRPVVLMHGNPTWGYLWRKVAKELLGEPVRLIVPDILGLGLSDKPRDAGVHQLATHTDLMSKLFEGLDLQGAIAVGQDWGGPIVFGGFARVPDRLAGIVVLNTVLGPPKAGFKSTAFHRFANSPLAPIGFRLLGFPQGWLHTAQGDRSSIRGAVRKAYVWPLRGLSNNVAPLALARMVPDSLEHPSIGELKAVQAFVTGFEGPKAIVWGDRDPVLGKLRRRTERWLPDAEVTVTQAGHFLQEEVPAEIAAAIRSVKERI
jgi:cis-3-alkyl-4-acyloxetan-2-one decarboxylase